MGERGLGRGFQLRDDALRQRLTELDAPLIEGVDIPDHPLGEHAVLVQRDQLAEILGCEPVREERIRRPVAFKYAMRHEPLRGPLGFDLLGRLAKRECLRLGKDIRQEDVVMPAERIQASS